MARSTRRSAGSVPLAQLERRVAELRRVRLPDVVVVPVYADDDHARAQRYVADMDARIARDAPGTVLAVVESFGRRPPGVEPPWVSEGPSLANLSPPAR